MEKARQPFRLVDSRPSAQAVCQGALFMYSGRVYHKKELICPEKENTLILFGGLALRLIISDFFERQAIKTTGVIRTLARFFNGFCSAFFLLMLYR